MPATTAAHAILTAIKAVGAGRVSIVSPYTKEVDDAEHRYFVSAGLEVIGGAYLGITDGFRLAEPSPGGLFKLGMEGCDSRADEAGGQPRQARSRYRSGGTLHIDVPAAVSGAASRTCRANSESD